jgi:uncharacterized membrane protein
MEPATMQLGARGLAIGVAALLRPRRDGPRWPRLAGDAIDLGLMLWAARGNRSRGARVTAAVAGIAATAALDLYAAQRGARARDAAADPTVVAVSIAKSPAEIYARFRALERLPSVMRHLRFVHEDGAHSRWTARLPVGGDVTWDAELTDDVPGERIAWRTLPGSGFEHRGAITFAWRPDRAATDVRVELVLGFAGLAPSAPLARLLARSAIEADLRGWKQALETEVVADNRPESHIQL